MPVSATPTESTAPKSNRRKIWATRILGAGALVAGGWLAGSGLFGGGSSNDLTTTGSLDPVGSLPISPTTTTAAVTPASGPPPTVPTVPTTTPTVVPTTDLPPITIPLETQPPTTPAPTTAPPTTTTVPTPPPTGSVTCTNDIFDYSLDYPAAWYTSDGGDPYLACIWFDPLPFDPGADLEIDVAVSAYYIEENIDQMAEWELDPEIATVVSVEETLLDGHRTIVALVQYTDGGWYPEGWYGYLYLIDWGGFSFELVTVGPADGTIAAYVTVLDEMAASLRLGTRPT